jgi:hypothetical protein
VRFYRDGLGLPTQGIIGTEFRAGDPMADYLPAAVESLRRTILRRDLIDEGELDAALAACRRHLADPDTVSTYVTVAQVWGRCPRLPSAPDRRRNDIDLAAPP